MYSKYYSPSLFRYFAMIIMAVLCLLLNSLTKINFSKVELPRDKPEYYVTGASSYIYNHKGALLYHLLSATGRKYPHEDRIFMEMIHAYMYDENNPSILKYEITANNGWFDNNKQLGVLNDNVMLIIPNQDSKQIVKIYGSNVNIDMPKELITSNNNVQVIRNNNTVNSQGFSYDYAHNFLKLNSKVQVIYNG